MEDKNRKPPIWKRRYLVQKGYQLTYSLLISFIGSMALLIAFFTIQFLEQMAIIPGLFSPNINIFHVTGFIFITWFLLGILYTHTTAGPVTQFINQLEKVGDLKLDEAEVTFRRGDDLQDLPEYFNNMVKIIKFRNNEEALLMKDLETQLVQAVKSEKEGDDKIGELVGAIRHSLQRVENLITKKERYIKAPKNERKEEKGIEVS